MRLLAALTFLVAALLVLAFAPQWAFAHLVRVPDHPTKSVLENRLVSQTENLAHCRYVARHGKGRHVRWHRLCVGWVGRERKETLEQLRLRWERTLSPTAAIRHVFGVYGGQAVRVSYCETGGTFDVNATNGQYLGLFQMGDYARSRYGHSSSALGQARAAYRYFVDSGRDWSPWECKP